MFLFMMFVESLGGVCLRVMWMILMIVDIGLVSVL